MNSRLLRSSVVTGIAAVTTEESLKDDPFAEVSKPPLSIPFNSAELARQSRVPSITANFINPEPVSSLLRVDLGIFQLNFCTFQIDSYDRSCNSCQFRVNFCQSEPNSSEFHPNSCGYQAGLSTFQLNFSIFQVDFCSYTCNSCRLRAGSCQSKLNSHELQLGFCNRKVGSSRVRAGKEQGDGTRYKTSWYSFDVDRNKLETNFRRERLSLRAQCYGEQIESIN